MTAEHTPLGVVEALVQERTEVLNQRIQDLEAEKTRIVGLVEDYRTLFNSPVWSELVTQARGLADPYLSIANPAHKDVRIAHISLAWNFERPEIYDRIQSGLFLPRYGRPKRGNTWLEVDYFLQPQPGIDFKYPTLNGVPLISSEADPSQIVEQAIRTPYSMGKRSGELERSEFIKTDSTRVRLNLDQIPR